ncbi:MAG: beta-ketoacyl-ACP synthase III [candidate division WOR-3 bacterium]
MFNIKITGTGSYLPEKVLTNFDLEKIVDTSNEWITTRTGIKERHIAAEDEATSDLTVKAGEKALQMAGLSPKDLDAIIVATITPDTLFPATACWVMEKLGAIPGIPAFDISAACSGYLYGLILSGALIEGGIANRVLLCGSEVLSRITNWEDRSTCVLFGDGAGCTVIEKSNGTSGLLSYVWGADGKLGELLIQPAGGTRLPASKETIEKKLHFISMQGNEVFKHAVTKMKKAALDSLRKAKIKGEEVDLYVPHQANIRIIEATIKRAGIPMEKTVVTIDKTGNMSAASIPVGIDWAVREGRLKRGDILLSTAFGGGFTWGGIILRW